MGYTIPDTKELLRAATDALHAIPKERRTAYWRSLIKRLQEKKKETDNAENGNERAD